MPSLLRYDCIMPSKIKLDIQVESDLKRFQLDLRLVAKDLKTNLLTVYLYTELIHNKIISPIPAVNQFGF